ncbi:MAG: DUF6614 family protein [Hyphomonadaceae bacterium]|nr:DUF6614 family protein [Hyphomonadaceae bacterium]
MDVYAISVDLKEGASDAAFAEALSRFLDALKREGKIEGWRLLRRKLGFGFHGLGEFQVLIETRDLAQLDAAFAMAATRSGAMETLHFGANGLVKNFQAALYRDFPDAVRVRGEEKF